MKVKYDLHIHSCLSPCADTDMTPATIAGMAALAELDVVALTDHNSTLNLPAFAKAAEFYGIAALYGMELSTAEDIHAVCLFDTLERAMAFGEVVDKGYPRVKNRPAVFGDQYVMDEDDNVIGNVEHLLIVASGIGFNELDELVESMGGVAMPAHVDKDANSAIAILGAIPPEARFSAFELRHLENAERVEPLLPSPHRFFVSSDAHRLADIGAACGEIELDCEKEELPRKLLALMRARACK